MLEKNEPYATGGPAAVLKQREVIEALPSPWGSDTADLEAAREEMPLASVG